MTEPVVFARQTVDQILDRAGRADFDRWQQQLQRCGHCSRPVRLRGRITRHEPGGRRTVIYSTHSEPDDVLLIRCGNRRASACPSCSREYAGDMWQLLYAGAAGGRKGVPESIRTHPLVFATLTAPSFGPVHTTREGGRRCHPRPIGPQPRRSCAHGRRTVCTAVHRDGDLALGQPLCPDCYQYDQHAAFNWHAPELWRRFTIALRRTLAHRCRMTPNQFDRRARVNFVKVAEFQRRAVVHFHALIRLDGPDAFTSPGVRLDADELADAIRHAASLVRLAVELPDGSATLAFGVQTDTQPVHGRRGLTPERVAAYIAKYATKSAEDFGLGDRRITPDAPLDVTDHIARLLDTCWQLGQHDSYTCLRRWLHMLGFRGHFATKSRRYSITLGAIRAERLAYREAQEGTAGGTIASWKFVGLGHLNDGDQALAASAAARARERRELEHELRTENPYREGTE